MAQDNILRTAAFGQLTKPEWQLIAPGTGLTDPLDLANHLLREAELIDTAFTEQANAVTRDGDLSAQGKATRLRKAAEGHRDALAKLRVQLSKIETARTEAATKAVKDLPVEDRLAALLQAQEIRRWLPEDALNVKLAYHTALEAGDAATLDAIETAPRLWPGRPADDQLADLGKLRLETLHPKINAEVGYLDAALSDVTAALDTTEAELIDRGKLATIDPVTEAAEGKPERTVVAEAGDRVA